MAALGTRFTLEYRFFIFRPIFFNSRLFVAASYNEFMQASRTLSTGACDSTAVCSGCDTFVRPKRYDDMKRKFLLLFLAFVSVTLRAGTTNQCESVMVEGMTISFTNSHGSIMVSAGKGFERRYTWAEDTRTVMMIPRKTRWYGSLGMYNPGAYIEGKLEPWKGHDGIKRFVVEEGQRHFTNTTDAIRWIRQGSGAPDNLDYIYNDTGLVVGMDKQPRSLEERKRPDFPGTLEVDVWQIYIGGKKPVKLEGSRNASITIYYPPTYDMEIVKPPSKPIDNFNQ